MIINHGADSGSEKDKDAVLNDGGAQILDAQHFLIGSLAKLSGKMPTHITLAGHSLGGVLADAQAVTLLKRHPNVPFHVMTFDSIGSQKYKENAQLADAEVAKVAAQNLAVTGNGGGSEAIGNVWTAWKEHLPLLTTHIFLDPFDNAKKGTVDLTYDVHHAMENFTPNIVGAVYDQTHPFVETPPYRNYHMKGDPISNDAGHSR